MTVITATPVTEATTNQAISAEMSAGLMAKVSEANKAIFALERLEEERLKWEKNELAASRQRLRRQASDHTRQMTEQAASHKVKAAIRYTLGSKVPLYDFTSYGLTQTIFFSIPSMFIT